MNFRRSLKRGKLLRQFDRSFDFYPVKKKEKLNWLEKQIDALKHSFHYLRLRFWSPDRFVNDVLYYSDIYEKLHDSQLRQLLARLRHKVSSRGIDENYLKHSFAIVRVLSKKQLNLSHYPTQIHGAWAMMHGMIIEMETGQGKSLTATLAASSAALAGVPTHIITVNEYLAQRDAEEFAPLYNALGLSVGAVTESMSEDDKRQQYARDITYATNKQITFDYLRDRMAMRQKHSRIALQLENLHSEAPCSGKLLLRGLCFAVVDEADSVLIDEAVTPLIISASQKNEQKLRFYRMALEIAGNLVERQDFNLEHRDRKVTFTRRGKENLATFCEKLGGIWTCSLLRNELVENALKATYLFHKDKQYLVNDENKIQLIDEFTGRVMADRSWQGGLQQMVEVKEGCKMSDDRDTIARISYQRFFTRYKNLCGMTGTALEVTKELWDVYGLKVMPIPTEQPLKRRLLPDIILQTDTQKWRFIIQRIKYLHKRQRAVLVGTRSVEASEKLSQLLHQEGIQHQLLNARQDKQEAEIIAQAGQVGRVTVATNMAGRGTDIKLCEAVKVSGGLHVIATERHESRRIDRQLFGRCGRQGDPGLAQAIVSLDDEVVKVSGPKWRKYFAGLYKKPRGKVYRWLTDGAYRQAQKRIERRQKHMRAQLKSQDEHFETVLSFSGQVE